jgi:hypothetical protein
MKLDKTIQHIVECLGANIALLNMISYLYFFD